MTAINWGLVAHPGGGSYADPHVTSRPNKKAKHPKVKAWKKVTSKRIPDYKGVKVEREPEVQNWLQRLTKELIRAEELYCAVCDRISCVLRGEPETTGIELQI